MSTHTDDSRPSTLDCPAWVRADRACRHAWASDKAWRKAARGALPPVHRAPGDGGTLGDQLLAQARRDLARERAGSTPPAPSRHHAAECNCPPCRKRKGERALPTLKQQQERRKRTVQADRTDAWRITEDPLVRFASLCEIHDDGHRHDVLAWLRFDFAAHLDAHQLFSGLERLLEERPGWACALIATRLLGRTNGAVAAQEGIGESSVRRRVRAAARFLAALYAGSEPTAGRARAEGRGAVLAELDEASRRAKCADLCTYLRRVALAPP